MGAAKVLGDLHRPSGKLFFDIRTVALMREHGVREIYTTDTASFQFQDLWVITPCNILERSKAFNRNLFLSSPGNNVPYFCIEEVKRCCKANHKVITTDQVT
jgi:hypothetical protein